MNRNIVVEVLKNTPVTEQEVEIVERKGIGHPDYICDAIAERIALSLSKEYLKNFGRILHFNIDKGLLVAGKVERRFGGGRVVKPMELIIGDRAVFEAGRERLDIEGLAIEAAREWIRENIKNVDPAKDINFRVVLSPGSEELTQIFRETYPRGSQSGKGEVLGANDTSVGVGYAPLSPTEMVVLFIERYLNSKEFKVRYPYTGEDIKVMGLRKGNDLSLTVAMPLLCRYIGSEAEYFQRKGEIEDEMKTLLKDSDIQRLSKILGDVDLDVFRSIDFHFNTLDKRGKGLGGVYLSLLGTSAEDADSGQVGRGNRVNGITSLNRPMSTEAAAGKNPVSHVGKIYNILAHELAREIYLSVDNIKEVYVWLLSQIGSPIDQPLIASVQVLTTTKMDKRLNDDIIDIVNLKLSHIDKFCEELVEGKHPVC